MSRECTQQGSKTCVLKEDTWDKLLSELDKELRGGSEPNQYLDETYTVTFTQLDNGFQSRVFRSSSAQPAE